MVNNKQKSLPNPSFEIIKGMKYLSPLNALFYIICLKFKNSCTAQAISHSSWDSNNQHTDPQLRVRWNAIIEWPLTFRKPSSIYVHISAPFRVSNSVIVCSFLLVSLQEYKVKWKAQYLIINYILAPRHDITDPEHLLIMKWVNGWTGRCFK